MAVTPPRRHLARATQHNRNQKEAAHRGDHISNCGLRIADCGFARSTMKSAFRELPSAMTGFHAITARWFGETFGAPARAQERGWAAIREGRHTLIAAPTGSGKTLAAFFTALDALVQEGLRAPLPDEVRVLYVSP